MRKLQWVVVVLILGIALPAWGQNAQGSFFQRPSPAEAASSPLASPAPPAAQASPAPALQPTASTNAPSATVRAEPLVSAPAAPVPIQPVTDRCGSDPDAVLQFLRFFFAKGSGGTWVVLGYQELIYADQVTYYGKPTSRAAVLKQKEAYLNRWPIRTYTLRGSGEIRCDEASGTYDFAGVVDWTASSPAISNGAVKSGAAIVRLGILASSISSFKIVRESSNVTERHPDLHQ